MPKLLELFKGTGSVGFVFEAAGWEVVSVDLEPTFAPSLCMSVLDIELDRWEPGTFEFVWASPPCTLYSAARSTGPPPDMEQANLLTLHTCNLIKALKPRWWAIENPATSSIWKLDYMAQLPYALCSYCHYSDWGYRKNTRIANNIINWTPMLCKYDCKNLEPGTKRHLATAQRGPASGREVDRSFSQQELYRIPHKLIEEMLQHVRLLALG